MNFYRSSQFVVFRVVFGGYLAIHFMDLIPFGPELFSRVGVLPNPSLNPTAAIFPNVLTLMDGGIGTQIFLVVLMGLSVLYAAGAWWPITPLLLWYGWACLFNRNNLIANPGLPFVGWLLLASALVPRRQPGKPWEMPRELYWGAWLLLALGYTVSGIHKLGSPSWLDGSALRHVFENPLARPGWVRALVLALPPIFLRLLTWSSLFLEVSFLPLAAWWRTRPLVWTGIVGMHIGILMCVDFADLTLGMLMIHLFTFDSRWLHKSLWLEEGSILFFDGVCGLCDRVITCMVEEDVFTNLHYSPLQGETAKEKGIVLPEGDPSTIVLWTKSRVYTGSDAILRAASGLGGLWTFVAVLLVVPKGIRDPLYAWIARHRYEWFGKNDTCRLPTPAEAARFMA